MHDLLEEPMISIRLPDGEVKCSLPDLLAELSGGRVQAYPRLREHQQDPFHVMTVQLASSVLAREKRETPPADSGFWKSGLLALAEGEVSAWHLVEEDPTKPAFLQSPCVSKEDFAKAYKPKAMTPDELDVLITAKDHDVKASRARPDSAEMWLAALITSQTTNGFLGRGNYGVIRMNGGFGSRAFVTVTGDRRPGPRFREELPIVLALRDEVLGSHYGYSAQGTVLTWVTPWTRKIAQHRLGDLSPTFIEAARPIRILKRGSNLIGFSAVSEVQQIAGPDNGDCGDPWTPLNVTDKKKGVSALTVSGNGLTPGLITDLLFEQGFQLTALQRPRPGTGRTWFCISVLVRGQGTTEGFHTERIPIPERARTILFKASDRDRLAALGRQLLADASTVERKCLATALTAMCEGGPASVDFGKEQIVDWARRSAAALRPRWSPAYFPTLWDAADAPPETVRARWVRNLIDEARRILEHAERTVPIPSSRRLRAAVRARNVLEATLEKNGMTELAKEIR